jgi:hypothetical protein
MSEQRPLDSEVPSRACECGQQMTFLGDLPQAHGKPAVHVFRCYGCNNVASEAKKPAN